MATSGKPLPFFKVFYAGGVGSVRGYETASLGPRDIFGNSIGGKRKIVGNIEAVLPAAQGRQVGALLRLRRCRPDLLRWATQPTVTERFRYSMGVGLAWNSPIGPLKFSYALPINEQPGDRLQKFQFQVGSVF